MTGRRLDLAKLLPPPGLPRAIAFQSGLSAIGGGTFLTVSVVFFVDVLGLRPLQVGVGFSLVAFVALVTSLPLGVLADRVGGRRSWALGALGGAIGMAALPLAGSYPVFLLVIALTAAADTYASAGRTIYTAEAVPPEGRVRTMAFARTYLNVGFAIGIGIGAIALAIGSAPTLVAVLVLAGAVQLVNAAVVARMPASGVVRQRTVRRPALAVLRDRPYVTYAALVAVVLTHGVIVLEILPLWMVTRTDAPKPLLGVLFALNTVLVIALQVRATRGTESIPATVRLFRRAALSTALACPLLALSGLTSGWVTIAVLVVAIVLTSATELWLSAVEWFFQSNVPPPELRGTYVGMGRMVNSTFGALAPLGLTLLAIQTGGWGWWVVAALFAACAVAAGPVIGWVDRTPRVDGIMHHRVESASDPLPDPRR